MDNKPSEDKKDPEEDLEENTEKEDQEEVKDVPLEDEVKEKEEDKMEEKKDDDEVMDDDLEEKDLDDLAEEEVSSHIPHIRTLGNSDHASSLLYSSHPRSKRNILHLLILVIVALAVIGATIYLLKGNLGGGEKEETPATQRTPVPTPEPTPTPQPTPSIDRSKVTLRILNGTSKTGFAASTSAKLKELGYKVEKTANATNSAFARTVVRVKADTTEGLLEQLIKDLSFEFDATSTADLKTSDTVDAEVILGAK